MHSVLKSIKMSHYVTKRAKRDRFIFKKLDFSRQNIASEASCIYILNGQKLIKNAKKCPFWRVFENLKLAVKQCYQTGQF